MKDFHVKKFFILTYGCQMNEYDSLKISEILLNSGYRKSDKLEAAEILIINTCSVREKAAHKVYSLIGALRKVKEKKKETIIMVCGCLAQQEGKKLLESIPFLSLVIGTNAIDLIPELILDAVRGKRRVCIPKEREVRQSVPGVFDNNVSFRSKGLLAIMKGCNNYCSYCIVPYVRGPEKSRSFFEILEEVENLVKCGVKEIVLLGQNVNSYYDMENKVNFSKLLLKISSISEVERLRFMSNNIKDLSDELIEVMASEKKIMEQLHLPVQSGSDRILAAMGRKYTKNSYLRKIEKLRKMIPEIVLGTDMIVGFPGEREIDFLDSLNLIFEVKYDSFFSFKYSDRPNTGALRLKKKVNEDVKSARLFFLQSQQREILLKLHKGRIGKIEEILVEGFSKKDEKKLFGRSKSGQVVNFVGSKKYIGRLINVKIINGFVNSLEGKCIV